MPVELLIDEGLVMPLRLKGLVGLTVNMQVRRANELADHFRARGIAVVLGGRM